MFLSLSACAPAPHGSIEYPGNSAEAPASKIESEGSAFEALRAGIGELRRTVRESRVASEVASLSMTRPSGVAFTDDGRCPKEMALIADRVCVDRWEATLVDRRTGNAHSPVEAVDGLEESVRAVSGPGVVPQGYISGRQAKLACEAAGKRLCRAEEWTLACKGPNNTVFPYGNERKRGTCNDEVRALHPVAEAGRLLEISGRELWKSAMNLSLINQLPETLTFTGERSGCTNDFGVYDMVGNLHEWVDDPSGTFRGGYYMDTALNGDGCNYQTVAHDFTYHDYSTGFRCCQDPESIE